MLLESLGFKDVPKNFSHVHPNSKPWGWWFQFTCALNMVMSSCCNIVRSTLIHVFKCYTCDWRYAAFIWMLSAIFNLSIYLIPACPWWKFRCEILDFFIISCCIVGVIPSSYVALSPSAIAEMEPIVERWAGNIPREVLIKSPVLLSKVEERFTEIPWNWFVNWPFLQRDQIKSTLMYNETP
jgi:hypothetical protein